jgi:hypothetical protein
MQLARHRNVPNGPYGVVLARRVKPWQSTRTKEPMTDERGQFLLTLQHTIDAVRDSEDTEAALREVRVRLDRIEAHVRATDDEIAAAFWNLLHILTLIKPRDESLRTAVEGADD